jgi:hypothetical protein
VRTAMIEWLVSFVDWLSNFIVELLVLAFFAGLYIALYERLKSIVMFVINIPRNTQAFFAEAKKRLVQDHKVPTSKTGLND